MTHFQYQDGVLHAESVSAQTIAEQYGTPAYVYSRAAFTEQYQNLDNAFAAVPHLLCYAVKANSNLGVLSVLVKLGSGFDIVSGGELFRVLQAGGDASKVVFSGVGKTADEIQTALEAGIKCFNVESDAELDRINAVATEMGVQAPVSLRVNPDVDANTHPYISTGLKENKFGVAIEDAVAVYQRAKALPGLNVVGVDCHIGSQLTEVEPFVAALERVLTLIDKLEMAGIKLQHLDIGGGLGICYDDEQPPAPTEYADALLAKLAGRNVELLMEPGRYIAGNSGVLLTSVEFLKHTEYKNFAVVDAAMNDLLRPALYSAWQKIQRVVTASDAPAATYDIVGPICETGDFLGKDRELSLAEGDVLAVMSSGAYGFVMSSNYNSRPRAVELMVDGEQVHVVRARESLDDLIAGEAVL